MTMVVEQPVSQLRLALYAVQFLTRVPVPDWVGHTPEMLSRSVRYYPLVGGLIGLLGGGVFAAASLLLDPLPAAVLAITSTVLVTGAFHEDGLADTWDGVGGGLTRERALEIMRDSRIGTYGGVALLLSVLLRVTALAMLAPLAGLLAMIAAHTLARLMVVLAIRHERYARADGLGKPVAEGVDDRDCIVAGLTTLAICAVAGWASLLALLLAASAAWWMLLVLVRKVGGYTGDGLGAIEQTAEVGALLAFAAWARSAA
jgi:adenosylcobinamide-GDP ribazoletransferase